MLASALSVKTGARTIAAMRDEWLEIPNAGSRFSRRDRNRLFRFPMTATPPYATQTNSVTRPPLKSRSSAAFHPSAAFETKSASLRFDVYLNGRCPVR